MTAIREIRPTAIAIPIAWVFLSYGALAQVPGRDALLRFSAEKNFQLGKTAYEAGNYTLAEEHLNAAIHQRKTHGEALFLRALTHEHLEDTLAALTDYNALIHLEPEHPEALYSRGLIRYELGHYGYARSDFERALQIPVKETHTVYYKTLPGESGTVGISTLNTMHAEMLNYIGLCYMMEMRHEQAIEFFDSVAQHAGPSADLLVNRGKAHEAIGDTVRAMADYRQALALNPQNRTARLNLSNIYSTSGRPEDAIREIEGLIADEASTPETLNQRGMYHYAQGNYAGARADFDRAIQSDRTHPEYYYNRGLTHMKTGNWERALDDFDQCLKLNAGYARAYQSRGAVYIRRKQYQNAIGDLSAAIGCAPDYGIAYYNRGIAHLYLHEYKAGCSDLNKADQLGVNEATKLLEEVCAREGF